MYQTILVTLDGTPTDRAIIEHVKQLAKLAHSRVVLLHVADGWAARTYRVRTPSARKSTEDTAYLKQVRAEFESAPAFPPRPTRLSASRPRNRQVGPARKAATWSR